MSEIESNSESIPKAKRKYSPRQPKPQAIPEHLMTPPPPNPNVLAMEAEILELVKTRSTAQSNIWASEQIFQQAQNGLKHAQEQFSRVEQEIQYRMSLIQQMRGGGSPPAPYFPAPHPGIQQDYPPAGNYYTNAPSIALSPPYAPAQPYPQYPPHFDPRMVPAQGVGSAPAPNIGLYPDVGGVNGARTESAEELRRDEMQTRGY